MKCPDVLKKVHRLHKDSMFIIIKAKNQIDLSKVILSSKMSVKGDFVTNVASCFLHFSGDKAFVQCYFLINIIFG